MVYHSLYQDETSELAHWNIPDTHPLETWGDPRAYDGTVTLMQPLIAPLYDAHSAHEVLATLTSGPRRKTLDIVKDYWTRAFGGGIGMDRPQRRRRDVRQCRRLLEAGRARRIHSRHGDGDRWSGDAVQAGSGRPAAATPASAPDPGCRCRCTGRPRRHHRQSSRRRATPAPTPAPSRRPPHHRSPAASSSCSGPIRRSGTAASPTTAGCRKRPSR